MRRLLYIIGAITLVLVVTLTVVIGVVAFEGNGLDAESKAFVDNAVPAITTSWSEDAFLERVTPELRKSARSDQLASFFGTLSQLGSLVEYQGAKGDSQMSYFTGTGGVISATYVAHARFQNGTATFRIVLLKRDEHWMIQNFHVDPVFGNAPRQGA